MSFGIIDASLQGRMKLFFPSFTKGLVPLEREANIRWRQRVFTETDPGVRKALRVACAKDALFYICGFVYLFDAGDESGTPGPEPFVLYPFQVESAVATYAALHHERRPLRIKKPRKLGETYKCLWLLEHAWHFMPNIHLLVGSHREEEVDSASAKTIQTVIETSKLLPKLDYGHVHMPPWMLPQGYRPRQEPNRTKLKMMNPENGSIIWGTSASGSAGHGPRGYAALWDECALTENLYDIIGGLTEFAPCKLWVSTILELGHPFSTVLRNAPGIKQVNLEWWMHPEFSKDLTIDPETGEKSSPWLRRKLDEINHDPILANRYYFANEDKQAGGYYHARTFETMLGQQKQTTHGGGIYDRGPTIMDPLLRGEFDIIDTAEGPVVSRFCRQPNGRFRLWLTLGLDDKPPRDTRYILGADIAAGTGATPSILTGADWLTGEIVLDYADRLSTPEDHARVALAVSKWLQGDDGRMARLNYENNGPFGGRFGQALAKLGHDNLVRQDDGVIGWYKGNNKETEDAFSLHQLMLCERKLTERNMECVQEMRQYQLPKSGKGPPIFTPAKYAEDPGAMGDNHGDHVITRIVICQVLQNPYDAQELRDAPPSRSYAAAKRKMEEEEWQRLLV